MIHLNWDPMPYLGPVPINWYGLTYALGAVVAGVLAVRRAPREGVAAEKVEELLGWLIIGVVLGARLYFVAQNDALGYLREPWRILAIWEGGLAYFGGLFGATLAGWLWCRRAGYSFARVSDLFAPYIPVGSAIGRISCGLDGMDYGTPTSLPWGVLYTNPHSYAPNDVPRHPDQYYELLGDLAIAALLVRLRGRLAPGALFCLYLVLFSVLRFLLFFVRGNVPPVALGLKNAQWTALAILAVAAPALARAVARGRRREAQ
jgi:phosphatidylglycerol:prolipoprotein diacylglycerol transferase